MIQLNCASVMSIGVIIRPINITKNILSRVPGQSGGASVEAASCSGRDEGGAAKPTQLTVYTADRSSLPAHETKVRIPDQRDRGFRSSVTGRSSSAEYAKGDIARARERKDHRA